MPTTDSPIIYLTVDDVIEAHEVILTEMGPGPYPLRSREELGAAIHRVPNAAHYDGLSFHQQAALLAISISQAQLFLEGNKRTAYGALLAFLRFNGYIFTGDPMRLADYLIDYAHLAKVKENKEESLQVGFEALSRWFAVVIQQE